MRSVDIIDPEGITVELLEEIQRFRAGVYGCIPAVVDGLHIHSSDSTSYHVLVRENGVLSATARYTRLVDHVDLGGLCIKARGSRDVLRIIEAMLSLAGRLGDRIFMAHASVEAGSASILRKVGGLPLGPAVWSEGYLDHYEVIRIDLGYPAVI